MEFDTTLKVIKQRFHLNLHEEEGKGKIDSRKICNEKQRSLQANQRNIKELQCVFYYRNNIRKNIMFTYE